MNWIALGKALGVFALVMIVVVLVYLMPVVVFGIAVVTYSIFFVATLYNVFK